MDSIAKLNYSFFAAIIILPWLFIATGCDQNFEPFQENTELFYSIYGYLDASADTQWVRVMPVREDFLLEPEPIDALVTLEQVNSGETVTMNDSLFSFGHNVFAYNYWTTIDLEPEQAYRLKVQRTDGMSSRAEVVLPENFPTPLYREHAGNVYVQIEGVERLADVQSVYHHLNTSTGEISIGGVPHLQDITSTASNDIEIVFHRSDDGVYLERFGIPFDLIKKQIYIASAGTDWHHFPSIDERVIALPEGISNIENGVGYLGGIVSKTIPMRSCLDEIRTIVPCPLESVPW